MQSVTASIITIGDELLIGQVVDTNSAWIAQQLNKAGIWLQHRVSVGDVKAAIIDALEQEGRRSDIVLLTGGLGPTADDITKPVLMEYFGGQVTIDDFALEYVKALSARLNRPLLERNLKQAEVPDSCTVIRNERGTAPGMWFEKDGKIYLSMPGVPYEMQGIMEKALPLLQARFTMPFIDHRTLMVANIGESFLAERIREWEAALPDFIKLAYLPNYNFLRLRLTGSGALQDNVTAELDRQFQLLQSFITPEELVATTDTTIEKLVGSLLKANRQTVCTAESCTGGYIAHLLTANPGSSAYFTGSVVSYDNRIKLEILQVDPAIPQTVGVVSRECVEQMVTGALRLLKTDYAVAVSGIMGPDGGTPEKPVGTVWIAVGNAHKTIVRQFNLRYDRKKNTELTAMQALNLLRLFILETSPATNNL